MDNDLLQQLPTAPQWAIWAGKSGGYLIDFGIALFALSVVLWLLQPKKPSLGKPATLCFFAGALSLLGAMGCLLALFVTDQFEFRYVFAHGDTSTALKYKVAGVWTAQEGSFLLWACTSALFGMLAFRGTGAYRRWYAITFSVFLACLCGILAYETPFDTIKEFVLNGALKVPHRGQGMTPSLQNYWVVIHPPTIFLGFGSLTVMFALSVAAMLTGNTVDWVKIARPWTLVSASILGLGLSMGGMWAYETQGWGGFWAWDPVENVSFVPWIFTAALIHGIIVQVTKKRWIGTNLILGGLPFLTFVYGTFLTRSGLLDKVSLHSFASMDRSALVVLKSFLIAVCAAFIVLYVVRGRKLAQASEKGGGEGLDRENFYRTGTLLLCLLAAGITVGMSWPWWSALRTGKGGAVEEAQYHMVVVWFFIPILLLVAVAPFVTWRGMTLKALFDRIVSVLSVTAGLTGFALVAIQNPKIGVHMVPGSSVRMPFGFRMALMPWMAVLIFVCLFALIANIWRIAEIVKRSRLTLGGFVAHAGLAILFAGLIISRGFEQTDRGVVDPAMGPTTLLGYQIAFDRLDSKSIDDRDGKVRFSVTSPDGQKFEADPGLYYYEGDGGTPTAMVWPYIDKHLSHDFYMAMAQPDVYAWEQPETFHEGETRTIASDAIGSMTITYRKFVRQGEVGTVGTTFGAELHIVDGEKTYDVTPTLRIGQDGPEHDLPQVGAMYRMGMLGMNAADRSVSLQLMFSPPLYPIVLFYKPMTILVWLGTGILTIGGLMSAFARRFRAKSAEPDRVE
ncbi:MAG: cytochrome c biogenesis protein CcsA [Fimbriimonas sp.]|nr:cytochrome c biogenesis protein CcsA [Fimbriimonas sp.]